MFYHYSPFLTIVSPFPQLLTIPTQFHWVPQGLRIPQWLTNVHECSRLFTAIHAILLLFTAVCGGSRCSRYSRQLRVAYGCSKLLAIVYGRSRLFSLSAFFRLVFKWLSFLTTFHNFTQFHRPLLLVIGCYRLFGLCLAVLRCSSFSWQLTQLMATRRCLRLLAVDQRD